MDTEGDVNLTSFALQEEDLLYKVRNLFKSISFIVASTFILDSIHPASTPTDQRRTKIVRVSVDIASMDEDRAQMGWKWKN